jgi:hypothetical protein
MKTYIYLIILFVFDIYTIFSQAPSIEWQKCLGGPGGEIGYSIQQTNDDGYIIAGVSAGGINGGDVSGHHGASDVWVIKLDFQGNIEWQKCLGGSDNDEARSVKQTADGGYIIGGSTYSNDGDVSIISSSDDFWVVKLDSVGSIQWEKRIDSGSGSTDYGYSIIQSSDEGYVIVGASFSQNADVLVAKLDFNGAIQWTRTLGGSNIEIGSDLVQTEDGGYLIACYGNLSSSGIIGSYGSLDGWLVKLDSLGNFIWQKCYGGSGGDSFYSIDKTIDGSFILSGNSKSNDGIVTGNQGDSDYWAVKIDSAGNVLWSNCFGSNYEERSWSVKHTIDNGFILIGQKNTSNPDTTSNYSDYYDYWVVKVDNNGVIQWEKSFGSSKKDIGRDIFQTSDGGYILTGSTLGVDVDVIGNDGGQDIWVVKLLPESSNIEEIKSFYKKLVKVFDIMGIETNEKPNEVLFYQYSDGSVVKKMVIEK